MAATARQLVCPHCHSVNRVAKDRDARQANCGHCGQPLFEGRSFPADASAFDQHINRNDIPAVVDFWADWCGPCKAMAAAYEAIAAEREPGFRFLKVDVDAEPAIAARYNIRTIPTLMAFRNGAMLAQRAGAVDRNSLRAWLAQIPLR
jgi:thioredoxin 2